MRNTNSEEPSFVGEGFLLLPTILSDLDCSGICDQLKSLSPKRAGSRRLLAEGWCASLARQVRMHPAVVTLLPADAVAFQCNLFDKSATRNWLVALHQDLSIPVLRRVDSEKCTGWSEKDGSVFTQPPTELLENLIAVRLHLDECDERSGPLRVVPRSHQHGRLNAARVNALRIENGEETVRASRGAALLMRPLLLHSSSKAISATSRRVLHFVFGPRDPGFGLDWEYVV